MGAGAFHGRVRKGNGCIHPAMTTRSAKRNDEKLDFVTRFCFHDVLEMARLAPAAGKAEPPISGAPSAAQHPQDATA